MNIFISYNQGSFKLVHKIAECFKNNNDQNFNVWIDKDKLNEGRKLPKIQEGILKASRVICFITKKYIKSDICYQEFTYAANNRIPCYYVLLEEIDKKEINGINMYIFNDNVRLDAYKEKHDFDLKDDKDLKLYKKIKEAITNSKAKTAKLTSENTSDEAIEFTEIPSPGDYFIGRHDIFERIDTIIQNENIVALTGRF